MSRYKKRGWFGESHRHYLAAKGIATKRFFASRLPTVPIGAFGPSKTAFGRMAENVGALTDVRHKKMVQRRDKLAGEVGEFALRREAISKSAADAPSLEGLSNVRRLVDKDTGIPLKDDATEEEHANAVREKLSQMEQAMMSGLRPEQEVRKKEIFADLGVGTSKLANALSAFPEYNSGPGGHGEIMHQSMDEYMLDLERNIQLEMKAANDPSVSDAVREKSGKLIEFYGNERLKAKAKKDKIDSINRKMSRSEKLSREEQRIAGQVVLDLREGKSHRSEDVSEREGARGLNITEYEKSQGRPAVVDLIQNAVEQQQPQQQPHAVEQQQPQQQPQSQQLRRKLRTNPSRQFVKPRSKIEEAKPLDSLPVPEKKDDKHEFEV